MNRYERTMVTWSRAIFIGAILGVFAAALIPAHAQPAQTQGVDAPALQQIGEANFATAQAQIATARTGACAAISDAAQCKSAECVIATKAIAALSAACGNAGGHVVSPTAPAPAPASQIINAAPPPTIGERIVGFGVGLVNGLVNTAQVALPAYMNYRLGSKQSDNNTLVSIAQSNNALAAQQSTNGTFASFGNNIASTATAGFASNATIGSRATYNFAGNTASSFVFGNGNNTQTGSDNRQTSPGPCVNTQTNTQPATGGNAGNGGTGATSPGGTTTPTTNNATNPAALPCTVSNG
jgi:hypothetical protein